MENKYPIEPFEKFPDLKNVIQEIGTHGLTPALWNKLLGEINSLLPEQPLLTDEERPKLTPEQIEVRKEAIDWYRNPGAESYELVFIPCEENDPRAVGGYTSYDGQSLCHVREGHVPVQQGAIWVKGDYDRLYDQLKAEPERKIACWVNYEWRYKNETSEILRDICAIMGKVMGFNARGIGYGGAETMIGSEYEKKEFLEECNRLQVQWLDESQSPTPSKESDAVEFAEWCMDNYTREYESNEDEYKWLKLGDWFTTEQLYELFLKQKEVLNG